MNIIIAFLSKDWQKSRVLHQLGIILPLFFSVAKKS